MKKIIAIILLLFSLFTFIGCKKEKDYSPYISQVRYDILCGESENLKITAHIEQRETPYLYDGAVGKKENIIIFKLQPTNEITDKLSIAFTTDKEYNLELTFDNLQNAFVCTETVGEAPGSALDIAVIYGDNRSICHLSSIKSKDTITYQQAISAVEKHNQELFSELLSAENTMAELNIRLLYDDNAEFYFVGIITDETTYAFLVHGKTAEIISEKEIKHNR